MSFKNSFSNKELSNTLRLTKICERIDDGEFKSQKKPFVRIFKFQVSGLNGNEETTTILGSYVDFNFFERNFGDERMLSEAQNIFKSNPEKLHFSSPEIVEDIII